MIITLTRDSKTFGEPMNDLSGKRLLEFIETQMALGRAVHIQPEETRCRRCQERETCPAFDTGVVYPCPYFKEETDHGAEE